MLTSEVTTHSNEVLLDLYDRMLLIRRFEERVSVLFANGKLPGFVHLYIGEEAVAVGVCSVLTDNDFITSTHRGHGHTIAKGGDVSKMMAELYGKVSGYCKGKGGSMHITDMKIGMLGANGIVSGGIPIAVGAAYGAAKIRHTDQVAVSFFGDGATNEGNFAEAINMASAWKLPVIFVCENNLYGVSTRLGRVSPTEDIAKKVMGYMVPSVTVDGNDVLAVREAMEHAVKRARAGEGPTFIECKTWRHHGHFEGENTSYMDKQLHSQWLDNDPIKRIRDHMVESGLWSSQDLDAVDLQVLKRIDQAVEFAEASEYPTAQSALDDLYA
jgi:acetoin:2,6-dichlorophenolindophenol oxidoreductase subunit alpha